jgi:hypothetical protein
MDTEEQLYYKEKYFKYKLKYLTLKEELEGGFKVSNPFSSKPAPVALKPTVLNKSEYPGALIRNGLINFISDLDNKNFTRNDSKEVLKKIMNRVIDKKHPKKKGPHNTEIDYDLTILKEVNILIDEFEKQSIKIVDVVGIDLYDYLYEAVKKKYFTVMK